MREPALMFLGLLVSACATTSSGPVRPAPESVPSRAEEAIGDTTPLRFSIPNQVAAFRFVTRHDFDDASSGTQIRYRTADSLEADVFLYPGPDLTTDCPMPCARRLLQEEHGGFVKSFGEMKKRKLVDKAKLLSGRELMPPAGARWRAGHHLHLQVRREGRTEHSDFWLVYLPGVRFKVRSTFVETPERVEALNAFLDEVVSAFTTPPEPQRQRDERPLPAAHVDSTFALLAGVWDWEGSDGECKSGTHTLTASRDRREFILAYRDRTDSTGAPELVRYRIVEAGPQVLAWAPHTIRMEMEGEDRKTDAGALVVWDLVFQSRDRYHWHRTDWAASGMTKAIIRCDAPSRLP